MRASMSANGSVIIVVSSYQLALRTPGIRPSDAMFRKQMRQTAKLPEHGHCTDGAAADLPGSGPRPPADLAPQPDADQVPRPQLALGRVFPPQVQELLLFFE